MATALSLGTVATPTVDLVLRTDLPGLTVAQRKTVITFTLWRLDTLPRHLFVGVGVVASILRVLMLFGARSIVVWLSVRDIPVISEYFRLIRSLAYSYVWETWPDTEPDGSRSGTGPLTAEPESLEHRV